MFCFVRFGNQEETKDKISGIGAGGFLQGVVASSPPPPHFSPPPLPHSGGSGAPWEEGEMRGEMEGGGLGNKGISEHGRREATCEKGDTVGCGGALCWDLFVWLVFYPPPLPSIYLYILFWVQRTVRAKPQPRSRPPNALSLPLVSRTKKQTTKPTTESSRPFQVKRRER